MLHAADAVPFSRWQPNDPEAIRQALALPATVPCLDAIIRAMADLERRHPAGVLSARALLDAVALIDQQLLAGGPEAGASDREAEQLGADCWFGGRRRRW